MTHRTETSQLPKNQHLLQLMILLLTLHLPHHIHCPHVFKLYLSPCMHLPSITFFLAGKIALLSADLQSLHFLGTQPSWKEYPEG